MDTTGISERKEGVSVNMKLSCEEFLKIFTHTMPSWAGEGQNDLLALHILLTAICKLQQIYLLNLTVSHVT